MTTTTLVASASLALALTLIPAAPARGATEFPLADGNQWQYGILESGVTIDRTVQGSAVINGSTCIVVHSVPSHDPQVWSDLYYSVGDDGDVFYHGDSTNDAGGSANLFVPPVLLIDSPLQVGASWSTSGQVYFTLDGSGPSSDYTHAFEVEAYESVTVPAGTFMAYKVTRAITDQWSVSAWYADGVGMVRSVYTTSSTQTWELFSYEVAVRAKATSWSAVKTLFAD